MALTTSDFKEILNRVVAEFVGTLLLVLVIHLAVGTSATNAALVIGVTLTALVYTFGPVSGAHFNPAVSLGVYLRSFSAKEFVIYVICQLGGGVCGAILGRLIDGSKVVPAIGAGHGLLQAFLAESIFTALFILTILSAVPKSGDPPSYFGGKSDSLTRTQA